MNRILPIVILVIYSIIGLELMFLPTGCLTFQFSPLATVEINDSANGKPVPVCAAPQP